MAKQKTNYQEKYEELAASMRNSISFFEKRAANAKKNSEDKTMSIEKRLVAGDLAREYQSVADEVKRLLENSEISYEERIAKIYDVDPINYD